MTERLAAFAAPVRCTYGASPLTVTFSGTLQEPPHDPAALTFSGAVAAEWPLMLPGVEVERLARGQYRLSAGEQRWQLAAEAVHLHRDVAAAFYAALPPRPVPLAKRLFWRLVLALAARRAGLALLQRLRR